MKDKPLRAAALSVQLRHSAGQDISSVHPTELPTVSNKTAAAQLASKLTRGTTGDTLTKTKKRYPGLLKAAVEEQTEFVERKRGSYQNYKTVGVDRGKPPVSSPASQLHGSRHIFDSYRAEDVTAQLSHFCAPDKQIKETRAIINKQDMSLVWIIR